MTDIEQVRENLTELKRFTRPGYGYYLVSSSLAALDRIEAKLHIRKLEPVHNWNVDEDGELQHTVEDREVAPPAAEEEQPPEKRKRTAWDHGAPGINDDPMAAERRLYLAGLAAEENS